MYLVFNQIHHYLSWLVLAVTFYVVIRAWMGYSGKKSWLPADNKGSFWLTILFDIQAFIGIILYAFLSPLTKAAFANFGNAMKTSSLRFYAVEHILVMLIALILVHIARSKTKKASNGVAKHKTTAIWVTIAFILMLSRIPWDQIF